jgi:glycosyltransferase involved in cell wall biosynthesis
MKIAILGCRGIPNRYGGYEAFAEKFAVLMAERGHEMSVFNSSLHPYQEDNFQGVEIIKCFDPENKIGAAGQFVYDLNCIMECRKRKFDVILQLGYTSSSVWSFLFPADAIVVTNMDGLEWKRDKYSAPVKWFLKHAEKWAVQNSTHLVADNLGIQEHLEQNCKATSTFIPYGAEIFNSPDESVLMEYGLQPYQYNILVARMEPENNIENVILGHLNSDTYLPLVIIGSTGNKYGAPLRRKYAGGKIKFVEGVYNSGKLNNLRWFSTLYFHGHSVGGTNPSLLEAMASSALICAHDNIFNRSVLNGNAFYFRDEVNVADLLKQNVMKENFGLFLSANLKLIKESYNWVGITDAYEKLFEKLIHGNR